MFLVWLILFVIHFSCVYSLYCMCSCDMSLSSNQFYILSLCDEVNYCAIFCCSVIPAPVLCNYSLCFFLLSVNDCWLCDWRKGERSWRKYHTWYLFQILMFVIILRWMHFLFWNEVSRLARGSNGSGLDMKIWTSNFVANPAVLFGRSRVQLADWTVTYNGMAVVSRSVYIKNRIEMLSILGRS